MPRLTDVIAVAAGGTNTLAVTTAEPVTAIAGVVRAVQGEAYDGGATAALTANLDLPAITDALVVGPTAGTEDVRAGLEADLGADRVARLTVATGADYPDALAGGPLQASRGAPLLLTRPDTLDAHVAGTLRTYRDVTGVTVLGGERAVSTTVCDTLAGLLE